MTAGELWGDAGRRLEEAAAADPRPSRASWSRSSRARARVRRDPDPLVRAAATRLERAPVADVAEQLAVSERHLRRLVGAEVGYGPKRLGRVLRLRRALARAARRGRARARSPTRPATPTRPTSRTSAARWRACRLAVFCKTPSPERASIPVMTETAKLGWVIVYVPDVEAAIGFYEKAFGLERRFVAPDASFGELDTGETRLAFASEQRRVQLRGGLPAPDRRSRSTSRSRWCSTTPRRPSPAPSEAGATAHAEPKRSPGDRSSPTYATRSGRSWSWLRQPTDHPLAMIGRGGTARPVRGGGRRRHGAHAVRPAGAAGSARGRRQRRAPAAARGRSSAWSSTFTLAIVALASVIDGVGLPDGDRPHARRRRAARASAWRCSCRRWPRASRRR